MAARIKQGYKLTQEHYAYIYAVSPRTILRWQKRELPLDEPMKMLFYLSTHPYCPMALKLKGDQAVLSDYRILSIE